MIYASISFFRFSLVGTVCVLLLACDVHAIEVSRREFLGGLCASIVRVPRPNAVTSLLSDAIDPGASPARVKFLRYNIRQLTWYTRLMQAGTDPYTPGWDARDPMGGLGDRRFVDPEVFRAQENLTECLMENFAASVGEIEIRLARRLNVPLEQIREEVIDLIGENNLIQVQETEQAKRHFRLVRKFEPLSKVFIEPFIEEINSFFPYYAQEIRTGLWASRYGTSFPGFNRPRDWYEIPDWLERSFHRTEEFRTTPRLVNEPTIRETQTKYETLDQSLSLARARLVGLIALRGRPRDCQIDLQSKQP